MTNYSCPMHPEVRSAQTGTCPKCGMKLEQQEGEQVSRARSEEEQHKRKS